MVAAAGATMADGCARLATNGDDAKAMTVVVLVAETVEDQMVEGMVHPSLVETMGTTTVTARAETTAARTEKAAA